MKNENCANLTHLPALPPFILLTHKIAVLVVILPIPLSSPALSTLSWFTGPGRMAGDLPGVSVLDPTARTYFLGAASLISQEVALST